MRPPLTVDGKLPFGAYMIRKQGKVEFGQASCGMCHTRVLPNGAPLQGAQGNLPFDRTVQYNLAKVKTLPPDARQATLMRLAAFTRVFYSVPWIQPDPAGAYDGLTLETVEQIVAAIPPGVIDRQGSSALYPVQVPDLIGIRDRLYLDHTGLQRHRGPGDIMRYGSLNQDMNLWGCYGDWIPASKDGKLPPPEPRPLQRRAALRAGSLPLFSGAAAQSQQV
jgi:hypothetical protein